MPYLIHQFEDKSLSHYAYAILSQGEIILIDPARNPAPYLEFAAQNQAKIVGVVETHPHADFVSCHLELHQTTGATIFNSKWVGASYAHQGFDGGDAIALGDVLLSAINTPGHSPDSICVLLSENGVDKAIFSGDTLFIGDCGRPDLREKAGNITAARQELAAKMYHSLRTHILSLNDDVTLYPAHGAGSLCGKALSAANSSTVGAERLTNWSLQPQTEAEFIAELTADQPFVPKYFEFDVNLNKMGAAPFEQSIAKVNYMENVAPDTLQKNVLVIDTRPKTEFETGHFPNSINLMEGAKFETWLGSIVAPAEPFYLVAETTERLKILVARIAKIGYETQIVGAITGSFVKNENEQPFDYHHFKENTQAYTIIDIRNVNEVKNKIAFASSTHIPLPELRERTAEIDASKPILVHCAAGYRSAAGSSIIQNALPNALVFDLGEQISNFL